MRQKLLHHATICFFKAPQIASSRTSMAVSPQWEYLTVLVSTELLDYEELHPKSVNGQELESWKNIDLNTFLSQLGADYWEMTGAISISAGEHRARANYLFFKRVKP